VSFSLPDTLSLSWVFCTWSSCAGLEGGIWKCDGGGVEGKSGVLWGLRLTCFEFPS